LIIITIYIRQKDVYFKSKLKSIVTVYIF
jgi:hypothetical protein